jgi:hypothetical protein
MSLKTARIRNALGKRTKKGFRGYPIATIAFYGPDDKKATKAVASILASEGAEPAPMKKWFSEGDVRNDASFLTELDEFLRENEARSIAMVERIIGCPHQEGIDYPVGEECPKCPFWKGKDRWAGE